MTLVNTMTGAYFGQDAMNAFMLIVRDPLVEIDTDKYPQITFSANGECLWSAGGDKIRMWRVEDGKQMATMKASHVECLAVSPDGKWIAAGTYYSSVFVWNAKTCERVLYHDEECHPRVKDVNFSPDSTRLIAAFHSSDRGSKLHAPFTILDIATCTRVLTLGHYPLDIVTAKYSVQGDRIATVARDSVQVWDSSDGCLLLDIKVGELSRFSTCRLLPFDNHLTLASSNKIRQIDAYTGSTNFELPLPDSSEASCIALPQHAEFLAYSTHYAVAFWDTSTRAQLARSLIRHTPSHFMSTISSIAVSPNGQFLAIGESEGRVTIKSLSRDVTASICLVRFLCI